MIKNVGHARPLWTTSCQSGKENYECHGGLRQSILNDNEYVT